MGKEVYCKLQDSGIEVLYDDRNARPGVKFADADLIGIPYQIIIGAKALEDGKIELKTRKTGEKERVEFADFLERLKGEVKDACQKRS